MPLNVTRSESPALKMGSALHRAGSDALAKIKFRHSQQPFFQLLEIGQHTNLVDQLDFPQRLKNAVVELALVKARFRLGPDADLNLSSHSCEIRDGVPCSKNLLLVGGEAQLNDLIGGRWWRWLRPRSRRWCWTRRHRAGGHRTGARAGRRHRLCGNRLREHQETGLNVNFVLRDGDIDSHLVAGDLIFAGGIQQPSLS